MARRRQEPEPEPPRPTRIADVAPLGDRRASLESIRDRLAAETDDTLWQRHKDECECYCGMGDGRLLIGLVKELRVVIAELETLPGAKELSPSDQLAERRKARIANSASQ
jgi:hypothetical protein